MNYSKYCHMWYKTHNTQRSGKLYGDRLSHYAICAVNILNCQLNKKNTFKMVKIQLQSFSSKSKKLGPNSSNSYWSLNWYKVFRTTYYFNGYFSIHLWFKLIYTSCYFDIFQEFSEYDVQTFLLLWSIKNYDFIEFCVYEWSKGIFS